MSTTASDALDFLSRVLALLEVDERLASEPLAQRALLGARVDDHGADALYFRIGDAKMADTAATSRKDKPLTAQMQRACKLRETAVFRTNLTNPARMPLRLIAV